METLAERRRSSRIERFRSSTNGTIHYQYDARNVPVYVLQHLDGPVPPRLGARVAELAHAMRAWIEQHGLGELVSVDIPLEVQQDFIVWPFHLGFDPIWLWDEPDEVEDLPALPELPSMRAVVEAALSKDADPDLVVHGAVRRSLLGPSLLTFYDVDLERFVVTQPIIEPDELDTWC